MKPTTGSLESSDTQIKGKLKRGSCWYFDGSVILQAGQTQFRVHKSILCACSTVFNDMFSLPQPPKPDSDSMVDGCDVVYLHDSAEDLELLLDAIYHHPNSGATPTFNVTIRFELLSALLRLGNKYDIPHLRDYAVCWIRAEYAPAYQDLNMDEFVYFDDEESIHFKIITLAYEEGVFSALPLALLNLAVLYDAEQIFRGAETEDSEAAPIPAAMIRACLEGRDQLIKKMAAVQYKWLLAGALGVDHPFSSSNGNNCAAAGRALKERVFLVPIVDLMFCLHNRWESVLSIMEDLNVHFCPWCTRQNKKYYEDGRRGVWNELPSIFGFGSWEEVKKMDRH